MSRTGSSRAPLVTRAGPGNFGLLPNGVFCVGEGLARVIETRRFARAAPDCHLPRNRGRCW